MVVVRWWGVAAAALAVAGLVALAWGNTRWSRLTEDLLARLDATRESVQPARLDPRELEGLPPPVQRYLRAVLGTGKPLAEAVALRHVGSFNTGESGERWKPFVSSQRVVLRRPGFVWDARIQMFPGVAVHVHDAYVGGEGLLRPAMLGLVALGETRGTPEIAEGELMRFLAESAWYPSALLPSQGVRWEAVDDSAARATLADGTRSVTLTFRFGADGLVETVRAEARGRSVGGRSVPTPWEGRWSGYERRDGLLVPMRGEVAWITPEGRQPYWRGTVTELRYEFAR